MPDIRQAARWYERQRPDLEQEFLDELYAAMDRLSRTGDVMPVLYRNLRCLRVRRFPYGIYDTIDENVATICCRIA